MSVPKISGALLKINTPLLLSQIVAVRRDEEMCVSRWAQYVCPERSTLSPLVSLAPLKSTTERNEHSPNIWLTPTFILSCLFSSGKQRSLLCLCSEVSKYYHCKFVQICL